MAKAKSNLTELDPIREQLKTEAKQAVQDEPLLGGLVHSSILHHRSFERALCYRIALKLASDEMSAQLLAEISEEAHSASSGLGHAARADLAAVIDRDPA